MSKKIILTADSACDLTPELYERYNVARHYPMHVLYDEVSYDDGININPDEIFKRFYATGKLPKTAAINVEEYADNFRPFVEDGCEVIHVSLGSSLSCTHANAKLAAEQFDGAVHVIDSQNLSTGIGLLVIETAERIAKGMPAKEIVDEVNDLVNKSHASFILDTLKFLAAGGRCSSVVALGANLLQIKPSIEVHNQDGGSMAVSKKYRGKLDKCTIEYVRDQMELYGDIRPERIFITHSGMYPEIVHLVRQELESMNKFAEIFETRASSVISSHCGPNCLGVLFMTET